MPRSRKVEHPDSDLYWLWLSNSPGRSASLYGSDVARFLRDHASIPVAVMTETTIEIYKASLSGSVRKRMVTALGHFFRFALESGRIPYDPVYRTKYSRDATGRSPSLFDLLRLEGFNESQVRELVWSDFIAPLVGNRMKRSIRIGRRPKPIPINLWNRLELRFRELIEKQRLESLLRQKIAS